MIRGLMNAAEAVEITSAPVAGAAYVDRDWLSGEERELPALEVADARGRGTDATVVAARALIGVAREAASVAASAGGSVEVIGQGLVAALVRGLVASNEPVRDERPAVVVDTTGAPERIVEALERVADLGTVVLAGESLGRQVDLDLYSTVHRRGLVLAGVAPPSTAGELVPDASDEELTLCRESLAEIQPGIAAHASALWYRIT